MRMMTVCSMSCRVISSSSVFLLQDSESSMSEDTGLGSEESGSCEY